MDFTKLGPADDTPLRAGFLTGRIIAPDGKPLRIEGMRVEFQMSGVLDSTEVVNIHFEVAPDGTYQVPLSPGTYTTATALIEFPFDGKTYRLPLVPLHRVISRQESSSGVVHDFVWKLKGLRPGMTEDVNKSEPWIGGSFLANYVSVDIGLKRAIRPALPGTAVIFTFTPVSKLANGQPGEPIVFRRKYDPSGSELEKPMLTDIPLATYRLTGFEERLDGEKRSLQFLQTDGAWTESIENGVSEQDTNYFKKSALKPLQFEFRRQE